MSNEKSKHARKDTPNYDNNKAFFYLLDGMKKKIHEYAIVDPRFQSASALVVHLLNLGFKQDGKAREKAMKSVK